MLRPISPKFVCFRTFEFQTSLATLVFALYVKYLVSVTACGPVSLRGNV